MLAFEIRGLVGAQHRVRMVKTMFVTVQFNLDRLQDGRPALAENPTLKILPSFEDFPRFESLGCL